MKADASQQDLQTAAAAHFTGIPSPSCSLKSSWPVACFDAYYSFDIGKRDKYRRVFCCDYWSSSYDQQTQG